MTEDILKSAIKLREIISDNLMVTPISPGCRGALKSKLSIDHRLRLTGKRCNPTELARCLGVQHTIQLALSSWLYVDRSRVKGKRYLVLSWISQGVFLHHIKEATSQESPCS
ncbi:uncharacterized protein LOC116915550 [Daphnia magna]|uniref:uncharacterized protein LOC116915550 n=1 Tax=Daphnia magna TaxID=35525 RepID=UPI001E1BB4B8|nr:uncharacterized protein LOC116915550 [Daphnia magna]